MGKQNRLTEVELVFIEGTYPRLTCAEIARKLGRSVRCIEKAVNRMGLRERGANIAPAHARGDVAPDDRGPQDELGELREMKRVLKRALRNDATCRDMPKLSAELREIVKRISELEEDDGSGGCGTVDRGAGNITVTVPLRPA